jgi:hypothetical protein
VVFFFERSDFCWSEKCIGNVTDALEIIREENLTQKLIQRFLPRVARIGIDPNDSDDLRLQKTLLMLSSFMISVAGIFWGIFISHLANLSPVSFLLAIHLLPPLA